MNILAYVIELLIITHIINEMSASPYLPDDVAILLSGLLEELTDEGMTVLYGSAHKYSKEPPKYFVKCHNVNGLFRCEGTTKSCHDQEYSYNTNIHHTDEMGKELEFKTVHELYKELEHCGPSLVLYPHKEDNGSVVLYYDRCETN